MASPLSLAEATKRFSPPPFSSYLPDPSPSSRRSGTNSLRRERRISNPEPSSPAITIAFNSATMERGGSADKGKEREKERRSNLPSTPTDSTGKKLKKRRSTRTPTEEKDRERRRERHVKRREEHRNSFLEVSDEDEPTLPCNRMLRRWNVLPLPPLPPLLQPSQITRRSYKRNRHRLQKTRKGTSLRSLSSSSSYPNRNEGTNPVL
ncbi:hypothetical protein BT69DRAFT_497789 [Atractiella rhizophila]|nr:hypothetical protein BT69DRAFT_497789 [Atractiella rhizophila]